MKYIFKIFFSLLLVLVLKAQIPRLELLLGELFLVLDGGLLDGRLLLRLPVVCVLLLLDVVVPPVPLKCVDVLVLPRNDVAPLLCDVLLLDVL